MLHRLLRLHTYAPVLAAPDLVISCCTRCGRLGALLDLPKPDHPSPPINLTPEEAQQILDEVPTCPLCGGYHQRSCPRVRRMTGTLPTELTEVEYFPPAQFDTTHIIWPEDLAQALSSDEAV